MFDLHRHEIAAGDHFRHRMLDLDARIHFQEEEFEGLRVDNEFHRAGAVVFGRTA